jgi:hypothetical protein
LSRPTRLAAALLCAAVLALPACGRGSGKASRTTTTAAASDRPVSSAQLQIVEPAANQVEKPDFTVRLNLVGGTVVPQTTGPLRGDQGHIHVSLDGQLVSMAYGTTQDLHGIAPGSHTLTAEFVAIDHRPFRNRIVTAVLFKVQP